MFSTTGVFFLTLAIDYKPSLEVAPTTLAQTTNSRLEQLQHSVERMRPPRHSCRYCWYFPVLRHHWFFPTLVSFFNRPTASRAEGVFSSCDRKL